MWKKFLELVPECQGYGWPTKTGQAELKSFILQAAKHVETDEPNWRYYFPLLGQHYIRYRLPSHLQSPDKESASRRIRELYLHLNMDASPGVPYSQLASTNGQLLAQYGEQLLDIIVDRLTTMMQYSLSEIELMTTKERYAKGLCDPIRIFVKDEPHDISKLNEGRVRLIMSVSIVDKIIQMYLRKFIHDIEIMNWTTVPSKPGISFDPKGTDRIYEQGQKLDISSDLSGYDWSYNNWMKKADVEFKIYMCDNPSPQWVHLMHASRVCLSDNYYQTSDGKLLKLSFKGIMNSGEYITGNCNSFTRILAAAIVGGFPAIAMGDDCLETYTDNAKEKYAAIGLKLKVYEPITEVFDFCSRMYTPDKTWLIRLGKVMMNAFHTDTSQFMLYRQIMSALQQDLSDHPLWDKCLDAMREVGFLNPEMEDKEIWVEDPNNNDGNYTSTPTKETLARSQCHDLSTRHGYCRRGALTDHL